MEYFVFLKVDLVADDLFNLLIVLSTDSLFL